MTCLNLTRFENSFKLIFLLLPVVTSYFSPKANDPLWLHKRTSSKNLNISTYPGNGFLKHFYHQHYEGKDILSLLPELKLVLQGRSPQSSYGLTVCQLDSNDTCTVVHCYKGLNIGMNSPSWKLIKKSLSDHGLWFNLPRK